MMLPELKFNRMEFAGSLADLGSLLPIAMAMVLINGIDPIGLFMSVALFYIFSGYFFAVPVPVQPMKIIAAYAIATEMSTQQIMASSLLIAIILTLIAATGTIGFLRRNTPNAVVCGVQVTTGVLLIFTGMAYISGESSIQQLHQLAEPYLQVQKIADIPVGYIIASVAILLTALLLNNKHLPAAIVVIFGGAACGLLLGAKWEIEWQQLGIHLPEWLPYGLPTQIDYSFALLALVVPQIPMTMGNAVLAFSELSKQYFSQKAKKVTNKNSCYSMAAANLFSFLFGGIPLCHGAGGLAAHYRFGARTAGSNLIIGILLAVVTIFLGEQIINLFRLLPFAILGVLLVMAGLQLTLSIKNLASIYEFALVALLLFITFVSNLAIGFIVVISINLLYQYFYKKIK